MIFKPQLIDKVLAGEKTVTRRPARTRYCSYRRGQTYAIQSSRGKKGIGYIRIIGTQRERLLLENPAYCESEAEAEGQTSWREFRQAWTELYGEFDPDLDVWRIRFVLVDPPSVEERSG
jgi:hypothetical protein